MPAPVVVSQCFPIKTRLAPGCHDKGHHYDVKYVFPIMVRTTGQRWKQKKPLVALFDNVQGDDDEEGAYVNSHHANNGYQNHFPFKILNNLQPDELVITLSPFSSGIVVFLIISCNCRLFSLCNQPSPCPCANKKRKEKEKNLPHCIKGRAQIMRYR